MDKKQAQWLLACSLILVLVVGLCKAETEYDSERYVLIVERSPFGSDPLAATEGEAGVSETVKKLEQELRLCFLQKTEEGEARAGFQNLKARSGESKSVMLMAGESFRSMKLIGIDMETSTATMQYQGKPVIFELSKKTGATAATAASTAQTLTRSRRFGSGFRRTTPPQTQQETQQQPAQSVLTPEEQAARQEQVRENLRQYQMEVIRSGMPPLPIPLTQEMDDQLVSEGVLPPTE